MELRKLIGITAWGMASWKRILLLEVLVHNKRILFIA